MTPRRKPSPPGAGPLRGGPSSWGGGAVVFVGTTLYVTDTVGRDEDSANKGHCFAASTADRKGYVHSIRPPYPAPRGGSAEGRRAESPRVLDSRCRGAFGRTSLSL